MAIDKTIDSAKLDREMLATANALREKGGTTATIPWEDETGYAAAVLAIKGGGDLNFEVVGGTTRPSTPKENTIWVNTSTEITKWTIGSTIPNSPTNGEVYIETDDISQTEISNILTDENVVALKPLWAMQYTGDAWYEKPMYLYSDGEWKDFVVYLIKSGIKEYSFKTYGANWSSSTSEGSNAPTLSYDSSYEAQKLVGTDYGYGIAYVGPIDLTNVDTVMADGSFYVRASASVLGVWSSIGSYISSNLVSSAKLGETDAELDVSGLTGMYYVGISCVSTVAQYISNLYMIPRGGSV